MKAIKVLGTGCANCRATVQRIEQVAKELGTTIALEKVEQIQDIMGYGILATPGVVVDGKVVHSGGVPAREKIAGWLGPREVSVASAEPIATGAGVAVAGDAPHGRARFLANAGFQCGSLVEAGCESPPRLARR